MPAPAAPPAPAPTKIVVPPLSKLEQPTPTPPAAGTSEPPPPDTAAEPPNPPQPPQPPAAPEIPTDIIQSAGGAPIGTAKSAADFAQERRMKKEEGAKVELAEIQRQYDTAKQELMQRGLELEDYKKKLEVLEKERNDQKALADSRMQDLTTLRASYFDANRVDWNPAEDPDFQRSQQALTETLRTNVPIRVPGPKRQLPDGREEETEVRVFFDAMLGQPRAAQGLAHMLDAYVIAKRNANEEGISMAVNSFAQWLGADVQVNPQAGQERKLLPASSQAFKDIERALESASPHHEARTRRFQQVQQEGPKLAIQQFENRAMQLRQMLKQDLMLTPDQVAQRLKADPNDSVALLSSIIAQVPELQTHVESEIAQLSDAYAAISDRLHIPGLVDNTPEAIAAHRQRETKYRGMLAKAMRGAAQAAVIGPILRSVIEQRDAAEQRANDAAMLTNPLPGAKTGKEGLPPAPQIQTEIITGR